MAEGAAKELPELVQKFLMKPEHTPYIEFQASARAMAAEAQNQKELLVRHGLTDTVLESLLKNLDRFDQVVGQGTEARRAHVGASTELDVIGDEIQHLVKVMDALNHFRFQDAAEILAEWESASNTFGPVRSADAKPGDGEIQPAA